MHPDMWTTENQQNGSVLVFCRWLTVDSLEITILPCRIQTELKFNEYRQWEFHSEAKKIIFSTPETLTSSAHKYKKKRRTCLNSRKSLHSIERKHLQPRVGGEKSWNSFCG